MIAEVSTDCRLDVDADEYVDTFKPFSMDIVYQWSQVSSSHYISSDGVSTLRMH